MAENDDFADHRQTWDRQELEDFVTKLRPPVNPTRRGPDPFAAPDPLDDPGSLAREPGARKPTDASHDREIGQPGSETSHQTAAVAMLSPETLQRLARVLRTENIEALFGSDVPSALQVIATERPAFVFTGLEPLPLHGHSLIAALRACPSHRSVPIAVITSRAPRLLDLSVYRSDTVLGESPTFEAAVLEFIDDYRVENPAPSGDDPPSAWFHLDGRVLLIEGSSLARRMIGKVLHVAGADVTVVDCIADAMLVTVVRDYDLVLLDLDPRDREDPAEMVRFLRAGLTRVPILGLTSNGRDLTDSGVDAILHTPARRAQLLSICSRLLGRVKRPTLGSGARRPV